MHLSMCSMSQRAHEYDLQHGQVFNRDLSVVVLKVFGNSEARRPLFDGRLRRGGGAGEAKAEVGGQGQGQEQGAKERGAQSRGRGGVSTCLERLQR